MVSRKTESERERGRKKKMNIFFEQRKKGRKKERKDRKRERKKESKNVRALSMSSKSNFCLSGAKT